MKIWMLLACASCMLADLSVYADNSPDDDDEYEEVIVRRKKKSSAKKAKTADSQVNAEEVKAEADNEELPAAPAVVPATVLVPTVVAVPAVAPAAPAAPKVKDKKKEKPKGPPPPPEPPSADAAEPRRLVRYFCKAWKDKDYERMWWAMSPQYRKKMPLKKFKKLFMSDSEMNGGLIDENIIETAKTKDGNEGVQVELIFKFPKVQHRFVMAVAERQAGGAFRMVDSPFIPLDLDDL